MVAQSTEPIQQWPPLDDHKDTVEMVGTRSFMYRYKDQWYNLPDLIRAIIAEEKEAEQPKKLTY